MLMIFKFTDKDYRSEQKSLMKESMLKRQPIHHKAYKGEMESRLLKFRKQNLPEEKKENLYLWKAENMFSFLFFFLNLSLSASDLINKSCSRETLGYKGFTEYPAAFCSELGNILTKLVLARITIHKQITPCFGSHTVALIAWRCPSRLSEYIQKYLPPVCFDTGK